MLLARLIMRLGATGIPRLVIRLLLDRRVPLGPKLALPAAVIYFFTPIDLLPDMLTPFGRLDDLVVLAIAVLLLIGLSPRDVVAEHMGRKSPVDDGQVKPDGQVVEGKYRFTDDPEDLRNQ